MGKVETMWDNPHMLRLVANMLFAVSALFLLYGAIRYVLHLPVFPLNAVYLSKTPEHVPVDLIAQVVREQVRGNFFSVDLNRTRTAFEHLPWVRKVSVRRKFPWGLEVELEEHVALARWGDGGLVNTYGEVFPENAGQALPEFVGQANTSAQMLGMYQEFNHELQPLNQQIARITLSPRFAWQLKLDNGMLLELGREKMQQRLARFVEVYPYSLSTLATPVGHVDLRYRDGFAVYLPGGVKGSDKRSSGNKV